VQVGAGLGAVRRWHWRKSGIHSQVPPAKPAICCLTTGVHWGPPSTAAAYIYFGRRKFCTGGKEDTREPLPSLLPPTLVSAALPPHGKAKHVQEGARSEGGSQGKPTHRRLQLQPCLHAVVAGGLHDGLALVHGEDVGHLRVHVGGAQAW